MGEPTGTEPTSTATVTPGISVILPAFNAASTLAATVAALREELHPIAERLEIIVVDDGSSDSTAEVGAALCRANEDVRFLRNRKNLGKGFAVYLGVLASRHDRVIFTDADLAFTPGSYARVVGRVTGRKLVVASRRMPDSEILVRMEVLGYASRRHLIGIGFNRIVRLLLSLPYGDTQCGLKAFDRETGVALFQRLRSPGFLFDVELFLAARLLHTAVEEIPVCIVYNDFKSSVRLAGDSARFLAGLLGIWKRERAGEYAVVNPEIEPVRMWAQTEELDGA